MTWGPERWVAVVLAVVLVAVGALADQLQLVAVGSGILGLPGFMAVAGPVGVRAPLPAAPPVEPEPVEEESDE